MYEFGPFRLDPQKKLLSRGPEPVTLTPKVLETLLLLVENRDKVLSKDDLMRKLWPDTFVDEANLSQNIFILRRTLGETAQDQRYIVTVRGTGYRFAEAVREAPETGRGVLSPVQLAGPSRMNRFTLGILSILATAAVVAGLMYWHPRREGKLTDKDTILVSDFDNRTGDPVFDGTLKQALTVQLEQTPYLSLISDRRVQAILKQMNRENQSVGREIAGEVCQRANGKAVIAGSIASLGKEYVITLEALNCSEGDEFDAEQVRAERKEEVLDSLGKASSGLRAKLGESLTSIRKFDVPLREATTSSLDALKAYTAGAEIMRHQADQSSAIPLFNRAIELDPNFALAHVYLSSAYGNIGESERAADFQTKAYSLRDRVSEREKLFITSYYHYFVTGDIDKEIETDKLWIEEYPRDWLPVNSLADSYASPLGQYEKSAELYNRAWELDFQQPYSPSGLAKAYLALNRVEDARAVLDRALAAKLDNLPIRTALYHLAILRGDAATAREQVRWSSNQAAQDNLGPTIAYAAAQQGHLRAAQAIAERDVKELEAAGFKEAAAFEYSTLALLEAGSNNFKESHRHVSLSLALFRGRSNLAPSALALALAGHANQSRAMIDELARRYPDDVLLSRFLNPCAHAAIEIEQHRYERAISLLEPVRRYDFGAVVEFYSLYLRGLAYLGNRQADAAAGEFEKTINRRGIAPVSLTWALAHLGLARAYRLSGDSDKARAAYQSFLALWKDADNDAPILQEAKAEYQHLK
ncbi:MAG: winged helix-turn-helix domain-containing protein [Acidobacteriia bacterium]|nr:winged helix-turn-helix domain-containing protein [Terriglobia bacterium]